jgi:hypothetical protein
MLGLIVMILSILDISSHFESYSSIINSLGLEKFYFFLAFMLWFFTKSLSILGSSLIEVV